MLSTPKRIQFIDGMKSQRRLRKSCEQAECHRFSMYPQSRKLLDAQQDVRRLQHIEPRVSKLPEDSSKSLTHAYTAKFYKSAALNGCVCFLCID